MSIPSSVFAKQLKSAFAIESGVSVFNEVGQFRALMRAFSSLKPQFYLEEFHGFKRQVYFDTPFQWQRARARCELCDVMFVVYSTNGGLAVRMTLLQAKLSRETHITGLKVHAGMVEPQEFKGNFEQWSLLSSRPPLIATTVFDPPSRLLSGALLPSVGTFGVFHKAISGPVDLFYVCADCLEPASLPLGPDTRHGKLKTKDGLSSLRTLGKWDEVTYCSSVFDFAKALYEMKIGTPILYEISGGERSEFQPHYDWVRSILASHRESVEGQSPILSTLLESLPERQDAPKPGKVPTIVVLRTEVPINVLG